MYFCNLYVATPQSCQHKSCLLLEKILTFHGMMHVCVGVNFFETSQHMMVSTENYGTEISILYEISVLSLSTPSSMLLQILASINIDNAKHNGIWFKSVFFLLCPFKTSKKGVATWKYKSVTDFVKRTHLPYQRHLSHTFNGG